MISLPVLAIIIGALGVIWWFTQRDKQNGKYKPIPGPWGLPILGNVLQMGSQMHVPFGKWADKYGKICQIHLGKRPTIIISDPKWLKEIYGMEFMTGRVFFEGFDVYPNEPIGLASIEGEKWEVHRKFLLRHLREFGYAKTSMGEKILEEVKEVLDRLKQYENKPLKNVKDLVLIAVINSLWRVAGSMRFEQDDPTLLSLQKMVNDLIDTATKHAITFFIPWTRFLMPKIDLEKMREKAEEFYGGIIKQHQETLQEDAPRDFIDVYLMEMKAQKDNPKSQFYGESGRRQLIGVIGDMMFAGTDSTSNTLQWALLYLTKFPHIQDKFRESIKAVTGGTRLVTVQDRPNMPYVLATIDEILRYASTAAVGVQRRATMGKEFKGYWIPKDAWVFGNFQYMHYSPELWDNPKAFNPERFLSEDGKTYKKSENLMPFSTGKRQCIGEPMARDTLFLFLTNIYQRYSTVFDPSHPEPGLEGKLTNLFTTPPDYHLFLKDMLTE